jgi:hypothetical protein
MTKDEALKLALDALEGLFGTAEQFEGGGVAVWRLGGSHQPKQAIAAIKEALAQPEQEQEHAEKMSRLGWQCFNCPVCGSEGAMGYAEGDGCKPKPEQEPVAWYYPDGSPEQCTTDKGYAEMEPAWTPLYTIPPPCPTCEALARTVMLDQTAHDTPPQPEQEPVACERCKQLEEQGYDLLGKLKVANIKLSMRSQRTWVGLTYEEESELIRLAHNHAGIRFYIQAAEAKLKEKNT